MDGGDGSMIVLDVVEVPSDIPHFLHDVLGRVVDFVSNCQALNVLGAVFGHCVKECANVCVDLQ